MKNSNAPAAFRAPASRFSLLSRMRTIFYDFDSPCPSPKVTVLCHLARAKQILQRARPFQLDGVAPIEWNLLIVQESLQKALSGHTIDIPDLDTVLLPPRVGTIDLTGPHARSWPDTYHSHIR